MLKKFIVILIIAGLIVALFYYLWHEKHKQHKPGELTLYGNVDIRQVDLGFRVAGRVAHLVFEEGDQINAGVLMAQLDPVPYEEKVAQVKAQLVAGMTLQDNTESRLQKREIIAGRAISQENYDDAYYENKTAQAVVAELTAALAEAKTSLEDTNLYAPSEGTILTRIREPGSIVNVGDPVYTLSLSSPIWVRAYITEPDLGKIYPGMVATIKTDTSSLPTLHGHIGFISPVAEFTPKTVETTSLRTDLVYRLRVIVDDPDRMLRQGMPVTVLLDLTEEEEHRDVDATRPYSSTR